MGRQQQVVERVIVEPEKKGNSPVLPIIVLALLTAFGLIIVIDRMSEKQLEIVAWSIGGGVGLVLVVAVSLFIGIAIGRGNERQRQAMRNNSEAAAYERARLEQQLALPPALPYNFGWGMPPVQQPPMEYARPLSGTTNTAPRRQTSNVDGWGDEVAGPPTEWNDL